MRTALSTLLALVTLSTVIQTSDEQPQLVCKLRIELILCWYSSSVTGLKFTSFCPHHYILSVYPESAKRLDNDFFGNITSRQCDFRRIVINNGKIEEVSSNLFHNFLLLEEIFIRGNELKWIQTGTFVKKEIDDHRPWTVVDLAENKIRSIERGSFSKDLKILVLKHNQLTSFDSSMLSSESLEILDLSHNFIIAITGSDSLKIKHLNLHHNRLFNLTSLPLKIWSVEHLELGWNRLNSIPNYAFLDNSDIKVLNLCGNGIQNLKSSSFVYLKHLEILSLCQNDLETIPIELFHDLASLRVLNLSGNHLKHFQYGLFNHLDHLETLDLSDNSLASGDLSGVYLLKSNPRFYFHNNQVDNFAFNFFPFPFREVSFYGNRFNFTCDDLAKIVLELNVKNISVVYGPEFHRANVKGIACNSVANSSITDPTHSIAYGPVEVYKASMKENTDNGRKIIQLMEQQVGLDEMQLRVLQDNLPSQGSAFNSSQEAAVEINVGLKLVTKFTLGLLIIAILSLLVSFLNCFFKPSWRFGKRGVARGEASPLAEI